MINQSARINYWEAISETHVLVAHNADIMEGESVIDTRKSFCADIADEVAASEVLKLHFPCVVANLVAGKVISRDDQKRFRYQNKLSFLHRFSVESDALPSIPMCKEIAYNITYNVMMDYLEKLLQDYATDGGCGYFKFIDEQSIRWEALDLVGSNMCGWELFFNDEEPLKFTVRNGEPGNWDGEPTPGTTSTINNTEIIYFDDQEELAIPWTDARKEKFGAFPQIQIWKYVLGQPELVTILARADAPPETFSFITLYLPGVPGFVVIK